MRWSIKQKLSLPYSILIKFLDLVVFDRKYRDESLSEGKADTILELYAEFQPKSLPPLLLESWLKEYLSPGVMTHTTPHPLLITVLLQVQHIKQSLPTSKVRH